MAMQEGQECTMYHMAPGTLERYREVAYAAEISFAQKVAMAWNVFVASDSSTTFAVTSLLAGQ